MSLKVQKAEPAILLPWHVLYLMTPQSPLIDNKSTMTTHATMEHKNVETLRLNHRYSGLISEKETSGGHHHH